MPSADPARQSAVLVPWALPDSWALFDARATDWYGGPAVNEPRPGDILDGCRLEAVLARGGMSIVFHARSLADGQELALKLPRGRFADDAVLAERFRR